jgi:tetraacyldisaccharide 4'-kinase
MVTTAALSLRGRLAKALQRAWESRGAASTALVPAAWVFAAIASLRRRFFAHGLRDTCRLPVPVVVVGNLVAGGAGKTPTVIAIAEMLRRRGYVPGIVSRGYGRDGDDIVAVDRDATAARVGDEPLLLQRRTGAPVVVGADRVGASHALLHRNPEVDVLVSDDGLQHLALERDVEVIVFDERGAGNGRLLPAGPLRERLPGRLAVRQLVLYNAPAATTPLPGYLAHRSLAGVAPLAAWWSGEAPTIAALAALRDREIVAVAGLARPERFFALLRRHGLRIVECAVGDHDDFARLPWSLSATDVVVTEKDAVKLPPSRRIGTRVWVARLDFALEPTFDAALLALLPPPRSDRSTALPPSTAPHGNPPP